MTMIGPNSACEVTVTPDDKGGVVADVFVPTYSGGIVFEIKVERDNDGDWRLFLPLWPDLPNPVEAPWDDSSTIEVCGGIVYLGAPDVERERN